MKTSTLLAGAIARSVPFDSPYGRALAAWACAMDDAADAEAALGFLRERVRVARICSADRFRRACDAQVAGQDAFARGLLDAAHAHERLAWEGESQIREAERRCAALRARCDDLDSVARREGERHAAQASLHSGDAAPGSAA